MCIVEDRISIGTQSLEEDGSLSILVQQEAELTALHIVQSNLVNLSTLNLVAVYELHIAAIETSE